MASVGCLWGAGCGRQVPEEFQARADGWEGFSGEGDFPSCSPLSAESRQACAEPSDSLAVVAQQPPFPGPPRLLSSLYCRKPRVLPQTHSVPSPFLAQT